MRVLEQLLERWKADAADFRDAARCCNDARLRAVQQHMAEMCDVHIAEVEAALRVNQLEKTYA